MDFFKSVFSDDPDPSDQQKDPTSPSQSPKNQDSDQEQDQNQESPLLDPTSNQESSSSSAWNFGGLMKTLATKSETVIQTYRRDLEEFGSGLKKETEAIREAASRAVKELPSSIEVGASVAQNSLESVGNVIDEFGNSVWRGTSEIISTSKDSISILSADVESDSSDTQYVRHSNSSKPYSRFELQVHAIQSDLATYSQQPDDMDDFSNWKSGFVLEEKGDEIDDLIAENGVMEDAYVKLVPSAVDHETFWSRYFYRVYKFKLAEDARANLVKRAISGEEEDLSWGDDDDDEDDDNNNNGYESKSVSIGVNAQKEDTPEIDKQSEIQNSVVVDGETTDQKPTLTPATATATAPAPAPAPVEEAVSENVSSENIQSGKEEKEVKSAELNSEPSKSEVKMLTSEKDGHSESSKAVVESKPLNTEEEDIGWDEIEDMESNNDKKVSVVGGSPNQLDLRKRLSTAEEEEDLSWDIEDDDEPVKH